MRTSNSDLGEESVPAEPTGDNTSHEDIIDPSSRRRLVPRDLALLLLASGLGVLLFFALVPWKRARNFSRCQSHLKQIGLATMQYSRDYDERFPLAANWNEALWPYSKSTIIFDCPDPKVGYVYNRHFDGLGMAKIDDPAARPMFFDSRIEARSATDFGESWPLEGVHQSRNLRGNNVCFADGHVKLMAEKPLFDPKATPTPQPTAVPAPITFDPLHN